MENNQSREELFEGVKYLMSGSVGGEFPVVIESGRGALVRDTNGKDYIDCTSQAWTFLIGAGNEHVRKAVHEQVDKISHVRTSFNTVPKLKLAKKLGELAPDNLKKISFCLHGSNAIESAMKLAMINNPEGMKFLTPFWGYAGRTMATMAASWPYGPISKLFPRYMEHIVRFPPAYCYRCPFGKKKGSCGLECAKYLETMIVHAVEPVTAIIMEPILAHGGMIDFPSEYLQEVRNICNRHNIILIFDEIQTGFGRLGEMFACKLYGVYPDILVFGKAIGGGYPLAGTLMNSTLKPPAPGTDSYTFAHFPISMAAAVATLEVIEQEDILEKTRKMGAYFTERLLELQKKYEEIGDIRGPGLMIGIELVKDRESKGMANELTHAIVKDAFGEGVIFGESLMKGLGNVLKIKPPAVISESQADIVLDVFEKLLVKHRHVN